MVLRPRSGYGSRLRKGKVIAPLYVHRTRWDPRLLALLKGYVDICMLHCYLEKKGMNGNGIKERRGNGTKEDSPSITLVPTYLKRESEFRSSEGNGELETYARRELWPSCLRISLARENQSAVVRITTGDFVCLCFFRLDNANVLAQVLPLAVWRLTRLPSCS